MCGVLGIGWGVRPAVATPSLAASGGASVWCWGVAAVERWPARVKPGPEPQHHTAELAPLVFARAAREREAASFTHNQTVRRYRHQPTSQEETKAQRLKCRVQLAKETPTNHTPGSKDSWLAQNLDTAEGQMGRSSRPLATRSPPQAPVFSSLQSTLTGRLRCPVTC